MDDLIRRTCVVGSWRRLRVELSERGSAAICGQCQLVVKLMQRFGRTGSVTPAPRGKKPYALAGHELLVRELVARAPI